LDNPSEELNPLDMMLSALGSCGVFVAERAAQELDIALEGAAATVEGDLDPSGVRTGEVNPRIQQFRVYLELPGANPGQQNRIVDNFEQRCPVYTTLSRAAEVEIFTDGEPGSQATEGLATATARIVLSNQPGRAIASARGNHWVIDSVPPLEGPNEERNPLDMMLGALATCGTFIYEHVALTEGIPLTAIAATVEGDLYPAGVATGEINPRLRAFRVHMLLSGATEAEAELMASEFQTRCPIYTTLVRAAPIEITTDLGD
ncbi:MAG: OsmC family protein, partial [Candidatus Promineifilaceae bacterium]|nr:OsmC family protein [Candidatus Promineifilaceae bacterium]